MAWSTKSIMPEGKIVILMSKEERKDLLREYALKKGMDNKGHTHPEKKTETLQSMNKKTNRLFERIFSAFDLKEYIVRNVIAYAKTLPRAGHDLIDRNIFDAQMKRHFKLTDIVLLDRMYSICCLDERNCKVYIDEYIELICIFLTELRDLKVQFVFRVYNARGDGFLNRKDLEYFIKPMFDKVSDMDESYDENSLKDFVEMLVSICDRNGDDQVELDEFRELAEQNVLMMECLGPCLPSEEDRIQFHGLLTDKTNLECSALFRFERRISLCEPTLIETKGIQRYYPVDLELP